MGGYLVNFSIYTMAMIGLIFFALMVYKKFSADGVMNKKSNFLQVEEAINIAPRKNLYVIKAGNERFLIAGDIDRTTLISKLNNNSQNITDRMREISNTNLRKNIADLPDITAVMSGHSHSNVLHDMVRKINN